MGGVLVSVLSPQDIFAVTYPSLLNYFVLSTDQ